VLVEVGAVEVDEPVRVPREVRRHPVEDHADAATVEMVTKAMNSRGPPKRREGAK